MAAYDGSISFNTKIDSTGFQSGMNGFARSFKKLASLAVAAFGVKQIIDFGKKAVETASNLQEVQNVVDTAFGSMSYKMEEFAKTSLKTFGISKLTAKETGSTFMAMSVGMGLAADTASDMSLALTGLSADMSSFFNKEQEITSTALKSIFTGETETLKQFGIVMTEANLEAYALSKGIKKNISDMTQAEKVQLRYNFVMSQTAIVQGDFAKTSDGWANQTRILSEQWEEFSGIVGGIVMNVLLPVVRSLNDALTTLIDVSGEVASTLGEMFGWDNTGLADSNGSVADSAANAAEAEDGLADSLANVDDAVNGVMSGFDELNKLQDGMTDTASGFDDALNTPAGTTTENVKIDGDVTISDKIREKIEELKDMLEPLGQISFDNLKDSLGGLKDALSPLGEKIGEGLKWLFTDVLTPFSNFTITGLLPSFINDLASAIGLLNSAISVSAPGFQSFYDNFLVPFGEWTGGKLLDALDWIKTKLDDIKTWIDANSVTFQTLGDDIGELAGHLWNLIEPIADTVWESFRTALDDIAVLLQPVIQKAVEFTQKLVDLIKKVAEFADSVGIFQLIGDTIGALFDRVWSVAKLFWDFLSELISGILEMFGGLIDFITGIFTGDWEKAWGGIQSIFSGFVNSLTAPINLLIDALNAIVSAVLAPINLIISGINLIPGMDIPQIDVKCPNIPKLANGAVIPPNKSFLAVLGDQKNGTNIEAPLETIIEAIRRAFPDNGGGGGNITIPISIGNDKLDTYILNVRTRQLVRSSGRG